MMDTLTSLARRAARETFYALECRRERVPFRMLSWSWRQGRRWFHRLARRQPPLLLVLDGPPRLAGVGAITGWAVSRTAPMVLVEAIVNGQVVARTPPTLQRQDVRQRFAHFRYRGRIGFRLAPPVGLLPNGAHTLVVRAHDARGQVIEARTRLIVDDYGIADKSELPEHLTGSRREYQHWLRRHEPRRVAMIEPGRDDPLVSVVIPVYRPNLDYLRAAVDSVRGQGYPRWELVLCDDGSGQPLVIESLKAMASLDPRIRWTQHDHNQGIAAATNTCIRQSQGDYVAFLDQDDALTPHALGCVVKAAGRQLTDYLYSDEDRLDEHGCRIDPFFKPDWSPDLVTSYMYAAHLGVYRRAFLDRLEGCRTAYDGAQDWELCLRATGQTTRIQHVAEVLYHWRMGGNSAGSTFNRLCHERGRRAIAEAIQRRGEQAEVADGPGPCTFHVRYQHDRQPLVSILIPTRDNVPLLKRCLKSIRQRTSYRHYEIIIIDNGSRRPATRRFLRRTGHQVLRSDEPFNHSRLNNLAAQTARGELLLLLNDDVEVLTNHWLTAMVEQALRPGVGAVGAWLLHPDGRTQHAGIVVGLGPVASPLHAGIIRDGIDRGMACLMRNVSAVTGACLMIRKELYQEMGGLDELNLPTSFNDVDLCLRLRQAGFQVIYTPLALLRHRESATRVIGDERPFVATMHERWGQALERDPYWNRHLPGGPHWTPSWAFRWQTPPDRIPASQDDQPVAEPARRHVRLRLTA
jgi:GT2 family glycosyltransferase